MDAGSDLCLRALSKNFHHMNSQPLPGTLSTCTYQAQREPLLYRPVSAGRQNRKEERVDQHSQFL